MKAAVVMIWDLQKMRGSDRDPTSKAGATKLPLPPFWTGQRSLCFTKVWRFAQPLCSAATWTQHAWRRSSKITSRTHCARCSRSDEQEANYVGLCVDTALVAGQSQGLKDVHGRGKGSKHSLLYIKRRRPSWYCART